jgi:hypothetical protein
VAKTSAYNLSSRSALSTRCDPLRRQDWFQNEVARVTPESLRAVLSDVASALQDFVRWPATAILLLEGCDRVPNVGSKQKYHSYPELIKTRARESNVTLDSRPNGPAIASFSFAGGIRPNREGSTNAWSIHHIYSGKFPHTPEQSTVHAKIDGRHFSQSAGLVAVHPVADALCDESPAFTWLLRAEAFVRFGYDPDGVFSPARDEYGFAGAYQTRVFHVLAPRSV